MGKHRWYKFSKVKMIIFIFLLITFLVLLIMELTGFDFDNFMVSFAAGTALIIFLITHLISSNKKKRLGKKMIEFRKGFLQMYSRMNLFDTTWGVLSFGDKISITLDDGNTIVGYLSNINDKIEIENEKAEIVAIIKDKVTNIHNYGIESFLNEPIRKSIERTYRTSWSFDGRYVRSTWVNYFNIWDSLSILVETCIKNRDYNLWNKLKTIGEKADFNTFSPAKTFNTRMQAHEEQNELMKSLISVYEQVYNNANKNI